MKKSIFNEPNNNLTRRSGLSNQIHLRTSSEVSQKPLSLSKDVQEQIRSYLKREYEVHLPILKLQHSRDISHIKDFKFSKHPYSLDLPNNLKDLKTHFLYDSNSNPNFFVQRSPNPEQSNENKILTHIKSLEYLEKIEPSLPSSRKEAENLLDWFKEMKEKYENDSDFEIVVKKCEEELIKQVAVECKHRGEMLKIILAYYNHVQYQKLSKNQEEFAKIEEKHQEKISKLRKIHFEDTEFYKVQIQEISAKLKSAEDSLLKHQQELNIYKRKFTEIQKNISEEQKKIRKNSSGLISQNFSNLEFFHTQNIARAHKAHKTELEVDSFRYENFLGSKDISASINENDSEFQSPGKLRKLSDPILFKNKIVQTVQSGDTEQIIFEAKRDSLYIEPLPEQISVKREKGKKKENFTQTMVEYRDSTNSPLNNTLEISVNTLDKSFEESRENGEKKIKKMTMIKIIPADEENKKVRKALKKSVSSINDDTYYKSFLKPDEKKEKFLSKSHEMQNKIIEDEEEKSGKLKRKNTLLISKSEEIEKIVERKKKMSLDSNKLKEPLRIKKSPKSNTPRKNSIEEKKENALEKVHQFMKIHLNSYEKQIIAKKDELIRLNIEIQNKRKELEDYLKSPNRDYPVNQSDKLEKKIIDKNKFTEIESFNSENLENNQNLLSYNIPQKSYLSELSEFNEKISEISQIQEDDLVISEKSEEISNNHIIGYERRSLSLRSSPLHSDKIKKISLIKYPHESRLYMTGFKKGYKKGNKKGFVKGKKIGIEEGELGGYFKAIKDLNYHSYTENSDDSEDNQNNSSRSIRMAPKMSFHHKMYSDYHEILNQREKSIFAEFEFNRPDKKTKKNKGITIIHKITQMSHENIMAKANLTKKAVNKVIFSIFQSALLKKKNLNSEKLILICYDEFLQRYGLKKVSRKKFIDFIRSVVRYQKSKLCNCFLRLIGIGNFFDMENYKIYTLAVFFNFFNALFSTKCNLIAHFNENNYKYYVFRYKSIEFIKINYQHLFEKQTFLSLINTIEEKKYEKINNFEVICLDFVLKILADSYQKSIEIINLGLEKVFLCLGYEKTSEISAIDLSLAVKYISPDNFSRFSEKIIGKQHFSFEKALNLCIELNILSENEVHDFAEKKSSNLYENYSELLSIIEKMELNETSWLSLSESEWRLKLKNCVKMWDDNSLNGKIAWSLYENELYRIRSTYLLSSS